MIREHVLRCYNIVGSKQPIFIFSEFFDACQRSAKCKSQMQKGSITVFAPQSIGQMDRSEVSPEFKKFALDLFINASI